VILLKHYAGLKFWQNHMTKHLIIIPGVGDDHPVYHKGARVFAWLGFEPQVHVFGWNSADAASYSTRIAQLNSLVSSLKGEVFLLGVSAGGSAAVNCFAILPNKITKTVTLCSPLMAFSSRINPLLAVSIEHTEKYLAVLPAEAKQRLLSLHAVFDTVVPIRLSKPGGVRSKILPSILHPITIFLGLTVFAGVISRFFKQG
jgi:pimeloyl-ACP methyl ester carboxylesterase